MQNIKVTQYVILAPMLFGLWTFNSICTVSAVFFFK